MFPLTRPVRQTLATLVLVGLTVVPTALVATVAWRITRPGHVRDVEIELGRQLGLQVTLAAVRYPRPGEVVYQEIVLRQEEPRGKGLVEIARADLRGSNALIETSRFSSKTRGCALKVRAMAWLSSASSFALRPNTF